MRVWESEDQRLWDREQEFRETKQRVEWGTLHPGDTWVRMTYATERMARDTAARNPDLELVKRVVDVETVETFNDWEVVTQPGQEVKKK